MSVFAFHQEKLIRDALLMGTNVLYCDNIDRDTGKVLSTPESCAQMGAGGVTKGASAFKSKYNVNSPADTKNNVRYIIVNYFKALSAQGKAVDSQVEGRFVIQK